MAANRYGQLVVSAVVLALGACSGGDTGAEPPASTSPAIVEATAVSSTTTPPSPIEPSAGAATTTDPAPVQCGPVDPALIRDGIDVHVSVGLLCGPAQSPFDIGLVERVVPDDGAPLHAALTQLLVGATPSETDAGFGSAFSSFTAGQFHSVHTEDGVAIIDLTTAFVQTNNFSTSNLGALVGRQIEATVFQFPDITGIDFRVDGERWCGWEATCDDAPFPLVLPPPR